MKEVVRYEQLCLTELLTVICMHRQSIVWLTRPLAFKRAEESV